MLPCGRATDGDDVQGRARQGARRSTEVVQEDTWLREQGAGRSREVAQRVESLHNGQNGRRTERVFASAIPRLLATVVWWCVVCGVWCVV